VQGKSPKWQRYYDGTFLVLEVIGDVNYRVQRSVHSKKQVVHVDKMKRYLDTAPLQWLNQPAASGSNDIPTPPELTFEDSFFFNLPESYEQWLVEEDPVEGSNLGDNEESNGLTPPADDEAETEEDEISNTDEPAPMSPLPDAPTDRPRRTVIKPARFRATESTDETPGQAPTTIPIDAEDLANEPDETEPLPQPQRQPQAARVWRRTNH